MEHEPNIGKHERRIRFGLGFLLIGIAGLAALPVWTTVVVFCLGIKAIYTGVHHFCPLWKLLGINTYDHHEEHH